MRKYNENGKISRHGKARIIRTPTKDRYYWFGKWQVYNSNGKFSHTEFYRVGNLVSSPDSLSARD